VAAPGRGNVLLATRPFRAGDIVLRERPLLTYEAGAPPFASLSALLAPLRAHAGVVSRPSTAAWALDALAFSLAERHVQAAVLSSFYTPPPLSDDDGPDVESAARRGMATSAAEFACWLLELSGSYTALSVVPELAAVVEQPAEALATAVLAFSCNGFRFRGRPALFTFGSKMNHACAGANTYYESSPGAPCHAAAAADGGDVDGGGGGGGSAAGGSGGSAAGGSGPAAQHVATGDIGVGEELTTSYLSDGALSSTRARRGALLAGKLFHCRCARCEREPDWYRALPCAHCVGGLARAEPDGGAGAGAGAWACSACGAAFACLDAAVAGGAARGALAPSGGAWLVAEAAAEAAVAARSWSLAQLQARYSDAVAGVGVFHWAPNRLLLDAAAAYCERLSAAAASSAGGGPALSALPPRPSALPPLAPAPAALVADAGDAAACAGELIAAAEWLVRWVATATPDAPEAALGARMDGWAAALFAFAASGGPAGGGKAVRRRARACASRLRALRLAFLGAQPFYDARGTHRAALLALPP